MGEKKRGRILNTFEKGMNLDSLHSLQPKGTYREAWGVTNKSDNENSSGVINEAANEIWVPLPKGTIRTLLYIEERDYYIGFFKMDSGLSEIGIINEKTKQYTKVVDDNDLPEPLLFSNEEWNSITAKVLQPCNQLHIYWSNGDYYYRLNIDDKCKEWKTTPIRLFREHCIGIIESIVLDGGGNGLPNGIYQPFLRLRDADGNSTNWFRMGQPIPIGEGLEGDNRAGENSGKAISIKTNDLHKDYGIADIGFHSVIGGRPVTAWVDTVAYGKGMLDYYYRGNTGKEIPLLASDVIGRNDLYIRGKSLTQYDSHLVLYNLRANNNLDWQREFGKAKFYWQLYGVPAREAHKFKGLRPNENYWFGGHANYVDGTKSTDFAAIGRDGSNANMVTLPGCDCEVPFWEVEDTTTTTKTFCDLTQLTSRQAREHTLTETEDNDFVTEYIIDPATGKEVPDNHLDNAEAGDVLKDLNNDVDDAIGSSTGKDLKSIQCICENLLEVLKDAEALGAGNLEQSVRFDGINKAEIYHLACACEELKDNSGNLVYPPPTFSDLIKKIVE